MSENKLISWINKFLDFFTLILCLSILATLLFTLIFPIEEIPTKTEKVDNLVQNITINNIKDNTPLLEEYQYRYSEKSKLTGKDTITLQEQIQWGRKTFYKVTVSNSNSSTGYVNENDLEHAIATLDKTVNTQYNGKVFIITKETDLKSGTTDQSGSYGSLPKGLIIIKISELSNFYEAKIYKSDNKNLWGNNPKEPNIKSDDKGEYLYGYVSKSDVVPKLKDWINQLIYKDKTLTITTPSGVNVRKEYPIKTLGKYRLGPLICAIGKDSKVSIIGEQRTYNNELWYKIKPKDNNKNNLKEADDCRENLEGWIIGQFRDGRKTIRLGTDKPEPDSEEINRLAGYNRFEDFDLREFKDSESLFQKYKIYNRPKWFQSVVNKLTIIFIVIIVILYIFWYSQNSSIIVGLKYVFLFSFILVYFCLVYLWQSFDYFSVKLLISSTTFFNTVYVFIGITLAFIVSDYVENDKIESILKYKKAKFWKFVLLFVISFLTVVLFDSYEIQYAMRENPSRQWGDTILPKMMKDLNYLFFDYPLPLANIAGAFILSIILLKFMKKSKD